MKLSIEDIQKQCNFLEYCFINAASKMSEKKFKALVKSHDGEGRWDIKLVVNGFELPLLETFKDIEKQRERMIEEAAKEQVENKLGNIENIFTDTIDDLREKLQLERIY